MKGKTKVLFLCCFLLARCSPVLAGDFIAFSLRTAQERAKLGSRTKELASLGGITRVVGAVYDTKDKDIVLVGRNVGALPACSLDDLVVALRSRLVLDEWPAVSIDPTEKTPVTEQQAVTFLGGLAGTGFGADFLQCDIILKSYSLGLLRTVPHAPTYRDLASDHIRRRIEAGGEAVQRFTWLSSKDAAEAIERLQGRPVTSEEACQIQFWFFGREPFHVVFREGVFWIEELQPIVRLRVVAAQGSPGAVESGSADLVRAGQAFADQFAANLPEVAEVHSALKRLKVLYDLVAVSQGIRSAEGPMDLSYFLRQYRATKISTSTEHEQVSLFGIAEARDGTRHLTRISGGIRFETELKWLNDGDVTPLREVVLESRPTADALSWTLPLEGWQMPNAADLKLEDGPRVFAPGRGKSGRASAEGCTVTVQRMVVAPEGSTPLGNMQKRFTGFPPPPHPPPPLKGVSMRMVIDEGSFKADSTGRLRAIRAGALKARPSESSPVWTLPDEEGSKRDANK